MCILRESSKLWNCAGSSSSCRFQLSSFRYVVTTSGLKLASSLAAVGVLLHQIWQCLPIAASTVIQVNYIDQIQRFAARLSSAYSVSLHFKINRVNATTALRCSTSRKNCLIRHHMNTDLVTIWTLYSKSNSELSIWSLISASLSVDIPPPIEQRFAESVTFLLPIGTTTRSRTPHFTTSSTILRTGPIPWIP